MTDFANLAIKVDSTEAGDAARDLDRLTASGKRADDAVDRLGATAAQSGNQMRGAGRAAADYAAAAQMAARQTTQMGEAGKLTAFQARNMAFQFQDLGVQFAMAAQSANPLKGALMALAMQGPQITSIMNEAGMSAGQLAKNMGAGALNLAKAHPILVGLTAAIGVAAGAMKLFTSEIEKSAELNEFVKGLGLTKDEMEKLGPVGVTAGDAFRGLWKTIKEGLGLEIDFASIRDFAVNAFKTMLKAGQVGAAGIYAAFVGTYRGIVAVWPMLPKVMGEAAIGAANLAIAALEKLINMALQGLGRMLAVVNPVLGLAGMTTIGGLGGVSLGRISNPFSGAGANAGAAFANGYKQAFGEAMGGMDGFMDTWAKNTEAAAKERLSKSAEDLIDDRSAKKGGAKAGKTMGKSAADEFAKEFAKMQADGMAGLMRQDTMRKEAWEAQLRDDLDDLNADLIKNQKERTRGAEEEAAAYARMNDQLRELVKSLDQLGGMGSTLGDLGAFVVGARTGDFSGARGPAGFVAQSLFTTFDADGKRVLNKVGQDFRDALDKVFGENGSFERILQNAGLGAAYGGMIFGQGNQGAMVGSTIGGAFGESAFKALAPKLFKGLGDFAGPLGTLAGSLLGGVFGALFGKRPRGSGSVSNTGINTSANDAGVEQSLDSFGLGLQSSLSQIAQQLGGSVGAYSIGIGQYKDYFQVSSSANDPRLGGTYFGKKSSSALYDGQDAGAAMRAAIAGAIAQGALQGISAGAQALLKSGKDIEAQLAKALKFQGVFDELKATTDPLGAALDEINKRFTELRTIFAEAGASAEEYAQLEQLLALKRQEAQDQARQAMVDKVRDPIEMQIRLLELLGREEDALAASRLLELAGIKAALQPLQAMIYQLEDARKVIDTFEPLAEDLKKFRNELLGGEGEQSFGYLAAQFRSIAQAAANGDATALANLRGAGSAYLDAARLNAGSDLEYRRALGMVLSGVDKGIFAADAQVDYAQAQIDAVNNTADILSQMREEMAVLQTQIVSNTGYVANLWKRFEVDGLPVTTPDAPLQVEVVTP